MNISPIQLSRLSIPARTGVIGGLLIDNGDGGEVFLDQSIEQLNLDGVVFEIESFELTPDPDAAAEGRMANTEDGFLHLTRKATC